ncbi:MAG: hypothetical protein ACIAXF_10820, partial [Phycisphaerales bacterium JB063]
MPCLSIRRYMAYFSLLAVINPGSANTCSSYQPFSSQAYASQAASNFFFACFTALIAVLNSRSAYGSAACWAAAS